jgi:hypothetical protein
MGGSWLLFSCISTIFCLVFFFIPDMHLATRFWHYFVDCFLLQGIHLATKC